MGPGRRGSGRERRRGSVAGAVVLFLLVASASTARAEEIVWDEDEPEPVYVADLREAIRFVIGFDAGIGAFDGLCSQCVLAGGLSVDGFAGLQVSRRVAVLADLWGVLHLLPSDGDRTGVASHAFATASGRLWVVPRLWVQAGLGFGALMVAGRGPEEFVTGPGLVMAIGGEPGHQPTRGVDLSVRLGASILEDDLGERSVFYSVATVVGFHWN